MSANQVRTQLRFQLMGLSTTPKHDMKIIVMWKVDQFYMRIQNFEVWGENRQKYKYRKKFKLGYNLCQKDMRDAMNELHYRHVLRDKHVVSIQTQYADLVKLKETRSFNLMRRFTFDAECKLVECILGPPVILIISMQLLIAYRLH